MVFMSNLTIKQKVILGGVVGVMLIVIGIYGYISLNSNEEELEFENMNSNESAHQENDKENNNNIENNMAKENNSELTNRD